MLLEELRSQVARYARKMHDSGLAQATQGNVSGRDPHSGLVCITPSGADYESLTEQDIVVLEPSGHVAEGLWKPSVEAPTHLEIYRRRADVHSVIHTHSSYATVFGVLYTPLPIILAESAYCLGPHVPIAPYQESGTDEFAARNAELLGDHAAIIWGNHGAMATGPTVALAYAAAHALEDNARVYWLAVQLGTPHDLPRDESARLHNKWLTGYRQQPLVIQHDRPREAPLKKDPSVEKDTPDDLE